MAKHGRLIFLLVIACAGGVAGVVGYRAVFVQNQIDRNSTALVALCALRHDLDLRIEGSRAFLREHPYGVDGLTAALIRQSLHNSQRTRESLNVLDCKEP